ncbi:hypothetical protein PVAND_007456 [Polypedilum vanderplanki]|uniref:C-type lectin n=1 Tax=Polypedilum vanderplanki TaxID=319348 RepID=A0A9J6C714_POLVA|nr:hypothetical protein PVAND_007456 [Polypedilum vanderplanki]
MKFFFTIFIIEFLTLVKNSESGGTAHLAPTVCTFSQDLYDPDRNYLKSLCWISDETAYVHAQGICRHDDMELFAVLNLETLHAFQVALTAFFGLNTNENLWINGLHHQNGSWITYTPRRRRLLNLIEPQVEYSRDRRCLLNSNRVGAFSTYAANCEEIHSFICEYDKDSL